ncbi:MAG: YceI family protein [Bacteroidales bacterium]|jgi:polyisoprenoid-binding protein YceI|nr:YceI family protein [Bacteroidales bacterium]
MKQMKSTVKIIGILFLNAILTFNLSASNYEIDKSESNVKWTGKKVAGTHYGTISLKKGKLEVQDGIIQSGIFEMDMNSIVNEDLNNVAMNKKLVGHLKSDDFFSVDNYPVSTLVIREVKVKSDKEQIFNGDLTIKGITKPVTFHADVSNQNGKLTAKGTIEIDRTLYDIKYGSGKFFASLGDNMIYDTFSLDFSVVANSISEKELTEAE